MMWGVVVALMATTDHGCCSFLDLYVVFENVTRIPSKNPSSAAGSLENGQPSSCPDGAVLRILQTQVQGPATHEQLALPSDAPQASFHVSIVPRQHPLLCE